MRNATPAPQTERPKTLRVISSMVGWCERGCSATRRAIRAVLTASRCARSPLEGRSRSCVVREHRARTESHTSRLALLRSDVLERAFGCATSAAALVWGDPRARRDGQAFHVLFVARLSHRAGSAITQWASLTEDAPGPYRPHRLSVGPVLRSRGTRVDQPPRAVGDLAPQSERFTIAHRVTARSHADRYGSSALRGHAVAS